MPTLLAGQSSIGTVSVTIPPGTTAGIYFLLACADDTKLVSETNETNNCVASANTVTAGPNFSLSPSSSRINVPRRSTGAIGIKVSPLNGFAGTVAVSFPSLPAGVSVSPTTLNISAGSTGSFTLSVATSAASAALLLTAKGTSSSLSHTASFTLGVPLGGGVLTIVPRTSGSNAFPSNVAAYLATMETNVAPVRLAECGTASGSYTVEMLYDPTVGSPELNSSGGSPLIIYNALPTPTSPSNYLDYNVHETAHALQYDVLHPVLQRGTQAEVEGFARACSDRVYRHLGLAGKDAPKTGGDDRMLWMDTLRRFDPEILAAGAWSSSGVYVQPEQSLGEAVYLIAASQAVASGINGLIEHENAFFAADPFPTSQNPLSLQERIKVWDSLSFQIDGQTAGAFMPSEMIQDPVFSIGNPQLIAWPEYPQFPAQMMAQAFVVTGVTPSSNPVEPGGIPTIQPVTSGPLTITVRDATPQHAVVLGPIQADFSQTASIANYSLNLQTKAPQGTYTVFVNTTINSTALQQSFVVANIPFAETGLGGTDLAFPGQYLIAVDSQGNVNNGSLTVTRGSVVWSMPGFAIVQADSTGTFDVTGPSGVSHTYTAPTPWARFIPVQ